MATDVHRRPVEAEATGAHAATEAARTESPAPETMETAAAAEPMEAAAAEPAGRRFRRREGEAEHRCGEKRKPNGATPHCQRRLAHVSCSPSMVRR
jgi:hypothetical protein